MSFDAPSQTAAAISWPRVPRNLSIPFLRDAAKHCQACDLWKTATQTVFGEGSASAKIILVGEQPGGYEDIAGKPFIGPAGKLLDQILAEAGIGRSLTYVTNVVKHFKWTPDARGKRRIHKKPNYSEISACRQWLDGEIAALKPEILVCMGATASTGPTGQGFQRDSRARQVCEIASRAAGYGDVSSIVYFACAGRRSASSPKAGDD
jgi:DNA polymerase